MAWGPGARPVIDRSLARQNLAEAERNVALGRFHLDRQIQIVAELERDGHDATAARELLETFKDSQEQHEAHRDRLLRELNGPEQAASG